MHWTTSPAGSPRSWVRGSYRFHDLISTDDELLGYIRENINSGEFSVYRTTTGYMPDAVFTTLPEAQDYLTHMLVQERLDDH